MDLSFEAETASAAGDFQPVERIAGPFDGGVAILCDHASNALPPGYDGLGLPPAAFARLGPTDVLRRRDRYWRPYRQACLDLVERMAATGRPPAVLSIHSFTPFWRGRARPWKVGVLWDMDPRLPEPLLAALANEPDLQPAKETIGDNEPYDGALAGDTIDEVATARGLANALIEVRQDLIAAKADAEAWAARLARLIAPLLKLDHMHARKDFGSRAIGKIRRA